MMSKRALYWFSRGVIALLLSLILWSCGIFEQVSRRSTDESEDLSGKSHQILLIGALGVTPEEGAVYSFVFNPDSLSAEHTGTFYTPSPSFMALDEERKFLYITNELPENAMVTVASFNQLGGELRQLNQALTLGNEPTYVAVQGNKVVTANYGSGSITLFRAKSDGTLSEADWRIELSSDGALSQPHATYFTPDGNHLYVPDKAQDKIFHFRVHDTTPPLTIDRAQTSLSEGCGPRHIVFDKRGKFAYVINELKPTIFVYRSHRDGNLELIQEVQTGRPERGTGAHIALSKDGRFLYASHRDVGDGITIFKVNRDSGELSFLAFQPTGKHPRQFAISPDGQYLAVAARDSGQVEFYKHNQETGLLSPTGYVIKTERPVFLLWEGFREKH